MKFRKILKPLLIALALFVAYDLIGAYAAYSHQPVISETTKQSCNSERFFQTTGSPERAAIIESNADALLQRVRLIENAEKEIILSTYSFQSDDSGKIVLGALLDAADRGVDVRVLVDGGESLLSMERNPYFYSLSAHENAEIRLYNRINLLKPWNSMGRMHDKYLIADNVYLLGGRNTYDRFLGERRKNSNFDRDVLVYCEEPREDNSVSQLRAYFETVWSCESSTVFHDKPQLLERKSVRHAAADAAACYHAYREEHLESLSDRDYGKDTLETDGIYLISNPIHTKSKEPTAWYELTELMKTAQERVMLHTPYIICNEMMYSSLREIAGNVPEFSIMTNSVANNGNPFGAADYARNRGTILDTGVRIWEYEGGSSYHGKSILIDDEFAVVGSFNLDMRSAYLDTELMAVIHSREVSAQMEDNMQTYEQISRQVLADGSYHNPYEVEPIALTWPKKICNFLVQNLLGWARVLF